MKSASVALKNTLQQSVSVSAQPKLLAEWEHNRFSEIDNIFVNPPETPDVDWVSVYDLDSVGLPNRPAAGIAKARISSTQPLPLASDYRDEPAESRYYLATNDDVYKYWSSYAKTASAPVNGTYPFDDPVQVVLTYTQAVMANKLKVTFETSYATPVTYTIDVSYNGSTWFGVPTDSVPDTGVVERWRSSGGGAGDWSATPSYDGATTIRAVRVTDNAMNKPNAHFDLVQLGLFLEHDLTEVLESNQDVFEISNRSLVTPLGEASSNTASVVLSNTDKRFNTNNVSSPYKGLIGGRTKFTLDLSVDASSSGGSNDERIRQLTMWSENWGNQDQASIEISLKDSSMMLQEITVPNVFWEGYTVGAIVWSLMDIVGMTNYVYTRNELDLNQVVPYFWPEKDKTVWDTLSSLAQGTQTAIFFDEYDRLQIKSHRAVFNTEEPVAWSLDTVNTGSKLADIVTLEGDASLIANRVDVNYRPARYSEFNDGSPKMETVWEPDTQSVTLRSSPVLRDVLTTSTDIWIRQTDADLWLYDAMVNIRGEILSYKGKEYTWYKSATLTETKFIYSQEEKDLIDTGSDPNNKWKNYFTGRLKISERGLFGSGVANHKIKQDTWSGAIMRNDRVTNIWNNGFLQKDGYIQMTSPPNADERIFHLKRHETEVVAPYVRLGGRIRFNRGGFQSGGFWFGGNNLDSGYYLNFQTTEHSDNIDKRQWRHEMSLLVAKTNGSPVTHIPASGAGGDGTKGYRRQIDVGKWYDIDIVFKRSTGGINPENITVFINGVQAGNWRVDSGYRPGTTTGRWGLFVRGLSQVDFDYAYSVGQEDDPGSDVSTWLDLKTGSFTSGYIQRDWKFGTTQINPLYKGKYHPQVVSRSNYAFAEFGPQMHEMREFAVNFDEDKVPVLHSSLYLSNIGQVAVLAYTADPFGAKFVLANASRENAVLSGDDSLSFGKENVVTQKMFIYGRAIYQQEDSTLFKEDERSIRRNGLVSLTFDSRFIQTKPMAEEVGEWVVSMFGQTVDEISVEIFGNPLLQLGDLVSVNAPEYDMTPSTHKYFVVAKTNSNNQGLTTALILRRSKF